MTDEHIQERVRRFLSESAYSGEDEGDELAATDSLSLRGIIDSAAALELIVFLEEEYGIRIEEDEVLIENLDSLGSISTFVLQKLRNGAGTNADRLRVAEGPD